MIVCGCRPYIATDIRLKGSEIPTLACVDYHWINTRGWCFLLAGSSEEIVSYFTSSTDSGGVRTAARLIPPAPSGGENDIEDHIK